jgi:ABC-type taurine transport system substrate-binding protein
VYIEQYQSRGRSFASFGEQGKGLGAIFSYKTLVSYAQAAQQLLVQKVGGGVVVDQQDARQFLHRQKKLGRYSTTYFWE